MTFQVEMEHDSSLDSQRDEWLFVSYKVKDMVLVVPFLTYNNNCAPRSDYGESNQVLRNNLWNFAFIQKL